MSAPIQKAAADLLAAADRVVEADKAQDIDTEMILALESAAEVARAAMAASEAQAEPAATLHDDGYWTPKQSEAERLLNDRLMRAGLRVDVYTHPAAPQQPAPAEFEVRQDGKTVRRDRWEVVEAERDAVLRQLDDRTNQTWVGKRARWAALVRAQDAEIARLRAALAAAPQPEAIPRRGDDNLEGRC